MTTEFVVKDTLAIQLSSMDAFAHTLGYWRATDGQYVTNREFGVELGWKGCEVISFNTMVKLHGSIWYKSLKKGFYYPECHPEIEDLDGNLVQASCFMTDGYTITKALNARIVDQVFLQRTKHGGIVCHKHLVKFCDYSYQHLFLGEDE